MKKNLLVTTLLIFAFSSYLCAKEVRSLEKMAYLVDGIESIKNKDIRLAFALWTQELAQTYHLDIETLYYDDAQKVIKDYENTVFKALTLKSMSYLKYQEKIDAISRDYYIAQPANNRFEKMLLLVRKNSKIKSFKDLKNRTVVTKNDSNQARFFLNKELLELLGREANAYIKEMRKTAEYTTAVLNVYFHKTDACIVPENIFKLVGEMNPAVYTTLTPIEHSQNIFLPSLTVVHKDTPIRLSRMYYESVTHLNATPRGESILTLFKIKRIVKIDVGDLQGLKRYYKEYLALKQKYRVKNE